MVIPANCCPLIFSFVIYSVGPDNNYGYAFNTGPPPDMGRYPGPYNSHQPQANAQPMDGSYLVGITKCVP